MGEATIFCNRCGAQNSAGARFCANCGNSFSVDAPVTPAPPAEVLAQPVPAAWQPPPPSYAAPAPPMAVSPMVPGVRYGGFWMRFLAAIIDGILVELVVFPVAAALGFMIGLAGSAVDMPMIGMHMVGLIVGATVGLMAGWIYEAAMESSSKQATVGKMALGLKVTDLEGRRLSFGRASGRHFAKFISGIIFMIGYVMAGFTQRKQALHDTIAGTLVQRTQ